MKSFAAAVLCSSADFVGNAAAAVVVVVEEGELAADEFLDVLVLVWDDEEAGEDDVPEDTVLVELPDEADRISRGVRKPSSLRSSFRNWLSANFFHFFHSYIPICPSPSMSPSA